MKVTKRNGETESFDRPKIIRSMRYAGADENMAQEIADAITLHDGIATDEIRSQIIHELDARNAVIARRYQRTLRFVAQEFSDSAQGIIRLTKEALHDLGVQAGETLHIVHEDEVHEVKVEESAEAGKVAALHPEDLKAVGAKKDSKIAIRLQM